MEALKAPLRELGEFEEIQKKLNTKKPTCIGLYGCVDSQKLHMIYGLAENFRTKLIVTYSEKRMRELYEDYRFYDKEVYIYPAKDLIFFQADIHGNKLVTERIKVMRKVLEGAPVTIITSLDSLMAPQLPIQRLKESVISINKETLIDEKALAYKLVDLGYEKTYQVEIPGQFSIRGGIVDIFDLTEENPFRIELWGDNVDSIRSFDVLSQRSIENLEEVTIYPATEMMLTEDEKLRGIHILEKEAQKQSEALLKQEKPEEAARIKKQIDILREEVLELGMKVNLEAYMKYFYERLESFLDAFSPQETGIYLDEPVHVSEQANAIEFEFRESMSHRLEKGYLLKGQLELLYSVTEITAKLEKYPVIALAALDMKNPIIKPEKKYSFSVRSVSPYNNSFETLVHDLRRYKKNGYRVLLVSASRTRASRLAEDLRAYGLTAFCTENADREIQPGEIMTCYGRIIKGFEYALLKFVVIAESDIFGGEKKKKKRVKRYEGQKIQNFTDLKVGDYVVHESHGLGIYQGIEKVEMDHVVKDYMKISYRDGGNLYVPATNLDVIQKYASADAKQPKLNKLGTKEWTNTKAKTKAAVEEVAQDLVKLYAVRQEKKGYQFSQDTTWQQEFEELFPFEETEDQMAAIAATKADMESTKIMDRLICGDVGYGKTEIAIRAAFKAVQEGKQVAFLVPTTILAQQHYNTFIQRMKDFPVTIGLLSRFRTAAEQKKTIEGLKKGMVDIVIGTHRLLSKDVAFKDLGLLVIDEEQRFGVTHKEKIKQMKDMVDVLTLTATPIPRTLHMSLVGIRDMSVLEEAPNDRMPIQTFVCEYNEEMVREAIVREVSRGGQVYYLYNRVNNIAEIAGKISQLVPEASVAFAHGQMKEAELEHLMYEFISGEIDVLVSTTIVETGMDIPNANTIIIHDSDNMGLSQLYQLRGRVGRSNRNAYAFLMYKRDKVLREVAEKRLQAIREFTDLGSGFKIAMRDLEIRGAGNILGRQQHGHMSAVGYDLYCKMLNEAVKNLKGEISEEDFNTVVELDADAYIPPSYILNEFQKLDIYKRIACIETAAESEDMKEELLDRFGEIPKSVDNLLRVALIRMQAHKLFVTELKAKNNLIKVTMRQDAAINVEGIPALLKSYKKNLTFQPKGTPFFSMKYVRTGMIERDEENLLQMVEELLRRMEQYLLS